VRATPTNPSNPLADGVWGVSTADEVGTAWKRATGANKALLGKIALQPRVRWFTSHLAARDVYKRISGYIAEEQHGDPDVLVQLAIFKIFPRGEAKRNRRLTHAEIATYKRWVNQAVRAIGTARAAVVLEPDLAETAPPMQKNATRTRDPRVRQGLARYTAMRLSALPRTSVYLDAGDADWLSLDKAVTLLANSGVAYARGFALGATHYSSVADNVAYAEQVVAGLEARGIHGKRAVIDTADNGRGFTWPYWHTHQRRLGHDFDNAAICKTPTATYCDTLGLPPTWDVARFPLPGGLEQQAATYVDAYLWFGRPWLVRQAAPFSRRRALAAARSTPYSQVNITGGAAYVH
jgi:hypothetical protein